MLVTANGQPCASVRSLHLSDPRAFDTYRARFGLEAFEGWPREAMVVCSRLAVLPEFRRSEADRAAFDALFRHELDRGTLFAFHACEARLVPLVRRFGFREYLPPLEDAVTAEAHRMVLLLDDVSHLKTTGSPFLSLAKERIGVSQTRFWFTARFPCCA